VANQRYQVFDLGSPHVAFGLNNRGQVVGQHMVAPGGVTQAVLLQEGSIRELGSLGGSFSTARGVNDEGLVVGGSLVANDEAHHGFLHDGRTMHDLNTLLADTRWEILHAFAINDGGEIVALASVEGEDRAVLLVPVSGGQIARR
jgi:probable HAF family extracellular repeat protein